MRAQMVLCVALSVCVRRTCASLRRRLDIVSPSRGYALFGDLRRPPNEECRLWPAPPRCCLGDTCWRSAWPSLGRPPHLGDVEAIIAPTASAPAPPPAPPPVPPATPPPPPLSCNTRRAWLRYMGGDRAAGGTCLWSAQSGSAKAERLVLTHRALEGFLPKHCINTSVHGLVCRCQCQNIAGL